MLDIQFIRDNAELVAEKSKQKGYDVDITQLLGFDKERRELTQQTEELRQKRNTLTSQTKGQRPSDEQVQQGRELKEQLADLEHKLSSIDKEYVELLKAVPNMPTDDVPVGASEDENQISKQVGEPAKFDFEPKSHNHIATAKGWLDKERAAKVTGSRFAYIRGDLVKLQFAIIQFVMDKLSNQDFIDEVIRDNKLSLSNRPFTPILPPFMLRTEVYDAMDRLEPREDRYKIEGEELWLQGSAEHVLGSMHADEIFAEAELPIRYIGYATSFRREAGTYGKDMEGMFRMHQFDKLEMESITTADTGLEEHQLLIAIQEKLMQLLDIPYQVVQKCTADIGKPNARGIDIDAWLPSQNKYRETHTADYMTDYQARRLKTRVRTTTPAKINDGEVQAESITNEFVHTNDATAIPLSRVPIGIIENNQTAEGNVRIPDVLQPYMGGRIEI